MINYTELVLFKRGRVQLVPRFDGPQSIQVGFPNRLLAQEYSGCGLA